MNYVSDCLTKLKHRNLLLITDFQMITDFKGIKFRRNLYFKLLVYSLYAAFYFEEFPHCLLNLQ